MIGEVSIAGVFVPSLLVLAIAASMVTILLMRLADYAGLYRYVAYRALVDLCLYILVLGALCVFASNFGFHL